MQKLEALKQKKESKKAASKSGAADRGASSLLPPGKADIHISHTADPNSTTCLLTVQVMKPGWIIKSVVIFNEALFEGDSHAVYPQ